MVIAVGIFGLDRASEICEVSGSDRAPGICGIFRGVARHGLGAYQGQLCHNDAPAARNAGTRGGGSAVRPLAASRGGSGAARANLQAACFGGCGGTRSTWSEIISDEVDLV